MSEGRHKADLGGDPSFDAFPIARTVEVEVLPCAVPVRPLCGPCGCIEHFNAAVNGEMSSAAFRHTGDLKRKLP